MLLIYALMSSFFPKILRVNFDFSKLFIFRVREEIGYSLKPFSKAQLLISGVYAMTLAFLILFLGKQLASAESGIVSILNFENYWSGLLQWLMISVGMFLLIYLKLIFLYLFSTLFHIGSGYQRQFADLFTTSSIFFLIASVVLSTSLYGQFFPSASLATVMGQIVIVFLFYQTILVYFKLLQVTEYSKLYIFSYICTTELIPLFIGLRYLIR